MNTTVPWLLGGRTGHLIGRWLTRHGWELTRVVHLDDGTPLARVRITPGHPITAHDIQQWRPHP